MTFNAPVGERFTQVYGRDSILRGDSREMRVRLGSLMVTHFRAGGHDRKAPGQHHYQNNFADYLDRRGGFLVPRDVFEDADFRKFFLEGHLPHVLDAITLIWQWHDSTQFDPNSMPEETAAHLRWRDSWHRFVGEVFREENLAYRLDEECGVHFLVDAEFAAQGNNLIRLLEQSRYESCRAEVTRCLKAIDASPPDTKVAVNAAFAAVEIIFKRITSTEGLTAGRVKSHLLRVVQDVAPNDLAAQTAAKHLIESFAGWVSASHFYRHGQADDIVVDPNIDAAVLLISQGWSWLRYLLGLDTAQTGSQKAGDTPKSF